MVTRAYKYNKGFTLVEILTAIVILTLLMSFAVVSFSSMIRDTRFKSEVAGVDGLIRRTLSECLARGVTGMVIVGKRGDEGDSTINEETMRGIYLDADGAEVEFARLELDNGSFKRITEAPTPWFEATEVETPSTFTDHTIQITATGMIENSGVIYLSYKNEEAAVEIMANGSVDAFYYKGLDDKGAHVWVR